VQAQFAASASWRIHVTGFPVLALAQFRDCLFWSQRRFLLVSRRGRLFSCLTAGGHFGLGGQKLAVDLVGLLSAVG
jgi:cytochrome b561